MKAMKKLFSLLFSAGMAITGYGQQRIALIEQFSNASCSICATYSPQVYDYADQNKDKVVVVTYHILIPYTHDSMYYETVGPLQARTAEYGINATPTSILDGNDINPTASFVGNMATKVDARSMVAPTYGITINNLRIENNVVQAQVIFTSGGAYENDAIRGHILLTEKVVPKTAYIASPGSNAEQEYKNVVRSIFDDVNSPGKVLQNKQNGGSDTAYINFALHNVKSIHQLRLVAFVQNKTTDEVLQTTYKDVFDWPASVPATVKQEPEWLYNAAEKQYTVKFAQPVQNGTITLLDITGRTIKTQEVSGATAHIPVSGLPTGIYMAIFTSGYQQFAAKLRIE